MTKTLDKFTTAYVECALSSTLPPYGDCPCCGKTAVLHRWDDDGEHVCADCSDREPHYEPPADDNYDESDIAPETLEKMIADCEAFQNDNRADLDACDLSLERQGHDFWLTRNGHGSGFWAEGYRKSDEANRALNRLTDASKAYGSFDLYVGDNGMIHGS